MLQVTATCRFRWILVCGRVALVAALALLGTQGRASAAVFYAATGGADSLVSIDTSTGNVTTLLTPTPNPRPDDLVSNGPGRVLYLDQGTNLPEGTTAPNTGQLRLHDFNTNADTRIAGGFSRPADLTFDPNGTSLLLTESDGAKIDRVVLATGVTTTLGTYTGSNPNGLAYDGAGHLFANLGTRTGSATSFLAQIDPTTGAILGQTTGLLSADGLAFDRTSGRLFAASALGSVLYSVNPSNLTDVLSISLPGPADGVVSDGNGNLFIGGRTLVGTGPTPVYEYTLATGRVTTVATIPVASSIDLALAPVPEPSSMILAGLGATALLGYRFRHRAAGAR